MFTRYKETSLKVNYCFDKTHNFRLRKLGDYFVGGLKLNVLHWICFYQSLGLFRKQKNVIHLLMAN